MTAQNRNLLTLKRDSSTSDHTPLSERLHKVLANAGLGSRRMLEQRIQNGEIFLNGTAADIGTSVSAGDRVKIDERQYVVATDSRDDAEVIVYNKPEGVLTTRDDPQGRATIFEQLPQVKGARWVAVGRLDANTSGLMLLTTDGELANALMHPRSGIEREYLCRVHGEVPATVLEKLKAGITLDDGPAQFEQIIAISSDSSHSWFRVVIREGRNREVRRMWESQGCLVSRLKRIRYGSVTLPRGLKRGSSETLDQANVDKLRQLAGLTQPTPALTLKPLAHQRRTSRSQTEIQPPKKAPSAWTGAYHSEAKELTAYDRVRPESTGRRGKPTRGRAGKEVNGNVIKPERSAAPKRGRSGRGVAPGQELPAVRSWFAGDERPSAGAAKKRGRGPAETGNRRHGPSSDSRARPGGNRGKPAGKPTSGRPPGKPSGKPSGKPGGHNPWGGGKS